MWDPLSDERILCRLKFLVVLASAVILGPSPAGLVTVFYYLRFETPHTGVPGTRIYIPKEHGGPVIPPGTGFPFRRLLRLAGLRLFEPASMRG
jgi:hypothetical protein